MIFKDINKILAGLLAAGMLMVSSCEVTDLQPADFIPENEAFADAQRVEATVVGVYEAAQQGFYLGLVQRGYPFGAASTEQGDMRGEDMYNDQLFYEVTYTNAYTPNTANNEGMWYSLYRVINRTNIVLEGLEDAVANEVISQEEADSYRGEMLFMRALSHHELLIHFSRPYSDDPATLGVPYRTFAINDTERVTEAETVSRGTVSEDYEQLLSDLDEAEALLEDTDNVFRADRGTVIALKSRIKLHMEDWQGVVDEYEKISSVYALTASPSGPFTAANSTESIFSLENSEASNPGVNGALVNMYGDPALGGRGLVKISPVIWTADFWLEGDLRREELTSINEGNAGIYTTKYTAFGTFTDPTPLLRYAEVVLNAAEAHARLGNLDDAVELLNSVRDRALPEDAASFTAGGLGNAEGVLQAILNERRIEFLAEGRRWPDIHRLSGEGRLEGIPQKAQSRSVTDFGQYTGEVPIVLDHSLNYSSYLFVWPIPLQEILNNVTLADQQNPQY